jgi:CubicO group peptidase (beta-lactamase class C family)
MSGMDFRNYVYNYVLQPMGVDTTQFNYTNTPDTDALAYQNCSDTSTGSYWSFSRLYGSAGIHGSTRQTLNLLMGIRKMYGADTLAALLSGSAGMNAPEGPAGGCLGWYTIHEGVYGEYETKNGLFVSDTITGSQQINTGMLHLSDGYDAVVLINSQGDATDPIVSAFEYYA